MYILVIYEYRRDDWMTMLDAVVCSTLDEAVTKGTAATENDKYGEANCYDIIECLPDGTRRVLTQDIVYKEIYPPNGNGVVMRQEIHIHKAPDGTVLHERKGDCYPVGVMTWC